MADIQAFSFYYSYHEALKDLPPEDRKSMLIAIDDFVFEDKRPNFTGTNKTIWILIEPTLVKSKNKSQNAKKEQKQNEIKTKTNQNQTPHDIFMNKSFSYIIYHLSNIIIKNNNNKDNIINSFKEYIQVRYDESYSVRESTIVRLINKLNEIAQTDEEKQEVINNAIDNKWKSFYKIDKKEEEITYETI